MNERTDDELTANQYRELRKRELALLPLQYPNFQQEKHTTLSKFIELFGREGIIENGGSFDSLSRVSGRILSKRISSKKLIFYTIESDFSERLQVMASLGNSTHDPLQAPSFYELHHNILRRGDIIQVEGFPMRTKRGEFSIAATRVLLLAPCLHNIPKPGTLKDVEKRQRMRYLDLITNRSESMEVFVRRSRIVASIREFFNAKNYIEVETPVLSLQAGGATAKPFTTHHNDLNSDMHMRIAPELFLKQLVIGGMDRVFEIGKNFRNEGVDTTHNPEFTSIEAYCAYSDCEKMMGMTEELLSKLALQMNGNYILEHTTASGVSRPIDFHPPFQRIPMLRTLEEKTGVQLPSHLFSSEDQTKAVNVLMTLLERYSLACEEPMTVSRMLDKLVGHLIEPDLHNPTFITGHPRVMSPWLTALSSLRVVLSSVTHTQN